MAGKNSGTHGQYRSRNLSAEQLVRIWGGVRRNSLDDEDMIPREMFSDRHFYPAEQVMQLEILEPNLANELEANSAIEYSLDTIMSPESSQSQPSISHSSTSSRDSFASGGPVFPDVELSAPQSSSTSVRGAEARRSMDRGAAGSLSPDDAFAQVESLGGEREPDGFGLLHLVTSVKEIFQNYAERCLATLNEQMCQHLVEEPCESVDEVRSRLHERLRTIITSHVEEVWRRFPFKQLDDQSLQGSTPSNMAGSAPFPQHWEVCRRCADGSASGAPHVGMAIGNGTPGHVNCHAIWLAPGSPEYVKVTADIDQRIMKIHSIARVQSPMQLDRIRKRQREDQLDPMTRSGEHERQERQLYHGTRCHDVEHDIARLLAEGLDQRLAGVGRFGRGIYFADRPMKAHMYTPNDTPLRCMLQCSVQLGNTFRYPAQQMDPELLREPQGYGSVVGNVTGQDEYVVYDNHRVMINYMILYQSDVRSTDAAESR